MREVSSQLKTDVLSSMLDDVGLSTSNIGRPPVPADEPERLAALQRLLILDSAPEEAYDDLVALASEVCQTPIALVSLIDHDRQWFKAQIGLGASETPRELAFCAHAIARPDDLFTVHDATADVRFANNPLVTDDPSIRFYAGAPIVTEDGHALGTVCVIDTQPRTLTARQERCLRALARQAAGVIDLRKRSVEAAQLATTHANMNAESRLKAEKGAELLDLVLQGRGLGLWDLDVPSGRWIASTHELEMLGYDERDPRVNGAAWRSLIHPDDQSLATSSMAPHLRGEVPFYECTLRMRHRDGHWLWFLSRAVVVKRDEAGRPLRIVGTHMDVTETRRREDERRQNAERLELALAGGDVGIWDVHLPTGKVVYNEHWATTLGYTMAEVGDGTDLWKSVIHHEDLPIFLGAIAAHLRGEIPMVEGEGRMRHRDGHWLWIHIRAKAFERDAEGRAVRIVGTNFDITDSKRDRLALEHAQNLLEETGRLASVGGWEVDLVASTVFWSREVYRIHEVEPGWKPSLADGLAFYAPEARPVISAAVDAAISNGTTWDLQLPLITARGRRIWIRTLGRAEYENGRPVRLSGAFQDITERKRADDALLHSEQRLTLALESSRQSIFDWDIESDMVHLSAHMAVVRGERAAAVDVLLDDFVATLHPDDREGFRDALASVVGGITAVFEHEHRIAHRDGRWIWIRSVGRVSQRQADGRATRVSAIDDDVTARRMAEQAVIDSERRLRMITDNMPALIMHIDNSERYSFVNAHFGRVFGIAPQAVIGKTMRAICGDEVYGDIAPHIALALCGKPARFEATGLAKGERLHYESHYIPDIDIDGRSRGFYALIFDVTGRKHAELRSLESEKRLRGIADNVPALIAEVSRDGIFRFANATYRSWLGLDHEALIGKSVRAGIGEPYYLNRNDQIERALKGEQVSFERPMQTPRGLRTLMSTYVPYLESDGSVGGFYGLTHDITELKETQQKLDVLARNDVLTGIPNRRHFEEHAKEAIARSSRSGEQGAIFYLDVDHFKSINDTLGHAGGDEVLQQFAARLAGCFRQTDFVARYAGDEFVAIAEGVGSGLDAARLAEKLIAEIRRPFTLSTVCLDVTTSIGVAVFDGVESLQALLGRADRALYDAKAEGRDGYAVASREDAAISMASASA